MARELKTELEIGVGAVNRIYVYTSDDWEIDNKYCFTFVRDYTLASNPNQHKGVLQMLTVPKSSFTDDTRFAIYYEQYQQTEIYSWYIISNKRILGTTQAYRYLDSQNPYTVDPPSSANDVYSNCKYYNTITPTQKSDGSYIYYEYFSFRSDNETYKPETYWANVECALTYQSPQFHFFRDKENAKHYVETGEDLEQPRAIDWTLFADIKSVGIGLISYPDVNYTLTWQPQDAMNFSENGNIHVDILDRETDTVVDSYTSDIYTPFTITNDILRTYTALNPTEIDRNYVPLKMWYSDNDYNSTPFLVTINTTAFAETVVSVIEGEIPGDGSTFAVVYGKPNDDDIYRPPSEGGDDKEKHDGNSSLSILTTTYATNINQLQLLGREIWADDFLTNLKLINNNPIENIISVKLFPHAILDGSPTTAIKLGNVDMQATGTPLSHNYELRKTIGSLFIPTYYNSFLDYAPYTTLSINLPYIGVKSLDTNIFMGSTLTVEYVIDLITGLCKAILYSDSDQIISYDGNMGIDIPITSSNRAEVELGYVNNILNASVDVMTGNVVGVAKEGLSAMKNTSHYQTSGTSSPCISGYESNYVFVTYNRPVYQELKQFNHSVGKMCNLSKTIRTLSGYTECTNVDVSGIVATDEEKNMIKQMLESGFYA